MYSFEETNPCDIPIKTVIESLKPFFPNIKKVDIRFLYHGTYNVFEVKEEYIFRFPDRSLLNEKGYNLIRREKDVIELLRHYISLKLPRFDFLSPDPKLPFVGYKKIPGTPLSRCYEQAHRDQRKLIAEKLGSFLSELHSPKVYKAYTNKWSTNFTIEGFKRYLKSHLLQIREKAYPKLDSPQRAWVDKLHEKYLKDEQNFNFYPRIVHGDFDTSNIIVDPHSLEVVGIVDFEEADVWDPAADFLFYDEGKDFINNIMANYFLPLGPNLEHRMHFFYNRIPLIYILTGYELGYSRMVDAGFKMFKERMMAQ